MPKNILVVVDMQPGFLNKRHIKTRKAIKACKQLVNQAKKNKDIIVLVEYDDFGQTFKDIKKHAEDHTHLHTVTKFSMDGSREIRKELKKTYKKLNFKQITLCGCYFEHCVAATAIGLNNSFKSKKPKMSVIYNACYFAGPKSDTESTIEKFEKRDILLPDLAVKTGK